MKTIWLIFGAVLLMGAECGSEEQVCDPGETQSCVCPNGDLGSQSCSSDGTRWRGCQCGDVTPPPPDAGPDRTCRPSGAVILSCGCWGPAYEGQVRTATGCCSGRAYSTAVGCSGYCAGGTIPWGNICL